MVAISLTALAGSALLLGTTSSMYSTQDAVRQTVAYGMAQQLMDEAVGCRYMEAGVDGHQYPLGPNWSEMIGGTRRYYDDIDDFNGWRNQPPTDLYGVPLGADNGQGGQRNPAFQCRAGYFKNWRQEVDVYYVSDADLTAPLPAGQTSDYRAVEVRITYNDPVSGPRQLAKLRRIVTYVAPLQVN